MTSARQYKCPDCKHSISITSADFIIGIAMASCGGCGKNAFAIETKQDQKKSDEDEDLRRFLRGGFGAK